VRWLVAPSIRLLQRDKDRCQCYRCVKEKKKKKQKERKKEKEKENARGFSLQPSASPWTFITFRDFMKPRLTYPAIGS
jgi:hypothetical protein